MRPPAELHLSPYPTPEHFSFDTRLDPFPPLTVCPAPHGCTSLVPSPQRPPPFPPYLFPLPIAGGGRAVTPSPLRKCRGAGAATTLSPRRRGCGGREFGSGRRYWSGCQRSGSLTHYPPSRPQLTMRVHGDEGRGGRGGKESVAGDVCFSLRGSLHTPFTPPLRLLSMPYTLPHPALWWHPPAIAKSLPYHLDSVT